MRVLFSAIALCLVSVAPGLALAAPKFEQVAREFTDGLVWLNADVRPAIANDGTVVFAGSTSYDVYQGAVLFSGDGGPLTAHDPSVYGLSNVSSPSVNAAGQLVFIADRTAGAVQRGVYGTLTSGGPFRTLHEAPYAPGDWDTNYVTSNVALSENGTVAFATIRSSSGAIMRGPFAGPIVSLRSGSGVFYNVRELDVNDAGSVAVQMEYTDPTAGLSRGILLFDSPEQDLPALDTAIERLPVSTQPMPAINDDGQVAFALNGNATLLFFDPPGVFSSPAAVTIHLKPGVYVSTPTPWGTANILTQYASADGPYASFGKVDIDDDGLVVFEATLDAGGFGIFSGPDAVLHKVVAVGDVIGPALFSWLRMGELNGAGELSLLTSDYVSTDRQVWRVSKLPAPSRRARVPAWVRLLRALRSAHH